MVTTYLHHVAVLVGLKVAILTSYVYLLVSNNTNKASDYQQWFLNFEAVDFQHLAVLLSMAKVVDLANVIAIWVWKGHIRADVLVN